MNIQSRLHPVVTAISLAVVTVLIGLYQGHQSVLAQDDNPIPQYDPQIHFYVEGLSISSSNGDIQAGSFGQIQPMAVESGSWFYPRGDKSIDKNPSNVRWNSCGGGDDAWVDYYYINENELWSGDIAVWAWNVGSRTHINNQNPPGLHGGYYCVGGLCTISVCATQLLSDPWSVFISYN